MDIDPTKKTNIRNIYNSIVLPTDYRSWAVFNPSDTLRNAIGLATEAFAGQLRRDGTPAVGHSLRVMRTLQELGHPPGTLAAAALHDTVEDTDMTPAELREAGFGGDVIDTVDLLTKPRYESDNAQTKEGVYLDYIDRLAAAASTDIGRAAIGIKAADIGDNMDNVHKRIIYTRSLSKLALSLPGGLY